MPAPHSLERRQFVIALVKAGHTTEQIEALADVGEATVRRWKRRLRETGSLNPGPASPGRSPKMVGEVLEVLLSLIEQEPDARLVDLAEQLFEQCGVEVDRRTVGRALAAYGYTLKKKTFRLSETNPDELAQQRVEFMNDVKGIAPDKMLFLDESSSNLAMTPTRARAKTGERAYAPRPTRRGKKRDDDRRRGPPRDGAVRLHRRGAE